MGVRVRGACLVLGRIDEEGAEGRAYFLLQVTLVQVV